MQIFDTQMMLQIPLANNSLHTVKYIEDLIYNNYYNFRSRYNEILQLSL